MECDFTAEVWHWRGPAPHHFLSLPPDEADAVAALADAVSYGWGMIPVLATVGTSTWRTSLFRKDGTYVLPLRASVRRADQIALGDTVVVHLAVGPR